MSPTIEGRIQAGTASLVERWQWNREQAVDRWLVRHLVEGGLLKGRSAGVSIGCANPIFDKAFGHNPPPRLALESERTSPLTLLVMP